MLAYKLLPSHTQGLLADIASGRTNLLRPPVQANVLERDWEKEGPWHEAGHAIAYLVAGHRVTALSTRDCDRPKSIGGDPFSEVLAVLAGKEASKLAGVGSQMSDDDLTVLNGCLNKLSLSAHHLPELTRRAARLVAAHWPAICHLRAALVHFERLNERDLAGFCREPGSPLAEFASLYPAATPTAQPTTGLRWSDEHQCYLAPRRTAA